MGDIFNDVVIFLEDYYVYVIGVGLILILMLVGLLASKRKARKQPKTESAMANINDVNTGSINDVANTLQNNTMQPVDVVTFPEEPTPVASPQPEAPVIPTAVPTASMWSEPTIPIATPGSSPVATAVTSGTSSNNINIARPAIEEISPVADDRFDKTEVIDFSTPEPAKPIEVKSNDFPPFIVDKSQYADSDNILNGENSSSEQPKA